MTSDKRILDLASELTKASSNKIPELLIQLKDYLDNAKKGTGESVGIKMSIWNLDIMPVILLALKEDYATIKGAWETALKIAQLCVNILTGTFLEPEDDKQFKLNRSKAAENMLILGCRINSRYLEAKSNPLLVKEASQTKLFNNFEILIGDILLRFLHKNADIIPAFLKSPWFIQIFITDDEDTALTMLDLFINCLEARKDLFKYVENSLLIALLDEMIYNLSVTDNRELASVTLNSMLRICNCHNSTISLICTRYRGLRLLLARWSDKGIGIQLSSIGTLLETGSLSLMEHNRETQAAVKIQAVWKSYATRKRLTKTNQGLSKFQRIFKAKLDKKEKDDIERREVKELKYQVVMSRQRRMRHRHEEALELMDSLPAPIVARHFEKERKDAATKLQATWRGHKERKRFDSRKELANKTAAVITIQRYARQWLGRREKMKSLRQLSGIKSRALTAEHREELQQIHRDWTLRQSPLLTEKTRQQIEERHRLQQTLFYKFRCDLYRGHKKTIERDTNLARLDSDVAILCQEPVNLSDITQEIADLYTSRVPSLPLSKRASQLHKEKMLRLEQPWWKQLLPSENDQLDLDDDDFRKKTSLDSLNIKLEAESRTPQFLLKETNDGFNDNNEAVAS